VLGRAEPLDVQRVPPESFRDNLMRIGKMCSEKGIPLIFATEPSSYPSLGVPEYVVESRYAASDESAIDLWRRYNELIREVSTQEAGWYLADLDSLMSTRDDAAAMFTADGIHFSTAGKAFAAGIERGIIEGIIGCGKKNSQLRPRASASRGPRSPFISLLTIQK